MSIQTGYEDRDPEAIDTPPEEAKWKVEYQPIGSNESEKTFYVRLDADGKSLGLLRLPSLEYVRWLRERLQGEEED